MSLNPNAREWTPNPSAAAFVPNFGAAAAQPQPQAAAPAPARPNPQPTGKAVQIVLGSTPKPATPEKKKEEEEPEEEFEEDGLDIDTKDESDQKFVAKTKNLSLEESPAQTSTPEPEPAKPAAPAEPKEPEAKKDEDEDEVEEDEEGEFEGEGAEEAARRHVNLVFIGHVDAGKSTLCGHIMYKTGGVDERTMDKFEREAKALGRESWKYAWAMDITSNERAKGKTEECGVAWFSTESKRFTILDAPGHKSFVPHMIGGASQADVAVLVISARKGEFETGFEKGGQTREHAMLAKTVGVRQIVVAITKMDDPTVEWQEERFKEIKDKLVPYLKTVGYGPNELEWIPISGLEGANIKDRVTKEVCPWYSGPALLEYLNDMQPPTRLFDRPLRLPIAGKYKERGVMVTGKLEAGTIKTGEKLVMMPNKHQVVVEKIYLDQTVIKTGEPGDNLRLKLAGGINEEDIQLGFVLCRANNLCPYVTKFKAQVKILEHKSILSAGYSCVMHIHSVVQEVTFEKLQAIVKGNKTEKKNPPFARPGQSVIAVLSLESGACVETYKEFQQLGRFMLRDEGQTIGIGIILDVPQVSN